MNERLKLIRKGHYCGKSQSLFAEYLGVSLANIASYESGRRTPSDSFISLICSKCSINEKWLRTGEGDMCPPPSREQEIAEITAMLYDADPNGVEYKLMKELSKLSLDEWKNIKDFINRVIEED